MAEPGASEEMEDGPTFRSTGGSSKDTVAGGTESVGSEQKRKKVPKCDSDSDSTLILDLTTADDEKDASVPLLRRTDSVMLKREMLGYTAEESLSTSDVSEDEYVPEPVGETGSDSPAEEGKQHKGKKREVQQTTSANSQGADVQPRSSKSKRRKWGDEEIRAVETTLLDYIWSGKVPGKAECLKCIETSPLALQGRRWEGVKFYVKNRIDALRRESVEKKR